MSSELQKDQQGEQSSLVTGEPPISLAGFEVLSVLGEGGMSTVYKARQEHMGRVVALKVLHRYLAQNAVHLQRFRQEARLSTFLDHPNIASLYSFGTSEEGQAYLVMEYCVGETLKEMMAKTSTFKWSQIHEIFDQICLGMAHAHAQGVIHRDLKPANIFISKDEDDGIHVKIIDFGIAKLEVADSKEGQKLTKTGLVIGSPHYMSPEQCQSFKVDARSDIYALGCMLYELISGQTPFAGESSLEVANKHVSENAGSMSSVSNLRVHGALEKLVAKAMSKKPEDRFQSAQKFREALDAISANSVQGSRKHQRKHKAVRRPLTSRSFLKAACLLAIPMLAVGPVFFSKLMQPQSVALAAAERVLNQTSYEAAFPMLVKVQNTALSDDEATNLVNDLTDIATMYRKDIGNYKIDGEVACQQAADAAMEPTANHPSKFSMCRAQLLDGQLGMGSKMDHICNILDMSGLSDAEKEYCNGRLAMIRALDSQNSGKNSDAAVQYFQAISHFTKAHAIPELMDALFEQSNLYSDGEHVEQNRGSWDTAYQFLPELMKCDGRLAARDLVFMAEMYLNGHQKYDQSKAALDRAGEIYARTKGGHADLASYYQARAELCIEPNGDNPDYERALDWRLLAYQERLHMRTDPPGVVYVLLGIANCQMKLQHPEQAAATLRLAVPLLDALNPKETQLGSATGVYTALAAALDDAGRHEESDAARVELAHYQKAAARFLQEKLRRPARDLWRNQILR